MRFKPKRPDGRSYRIVAIEFLSDKEPQTIIPYAKLAEVLEIELTPLTRIQAIVRSAMKGLLRLHRRGLETVAGVGYRVLRAPEHMLISENHRSKADRSLDRAIQFLEGSRREEMSEIERRLLDGQTIIMVALAESHRHLNSRLTKLEKLLHGGETIAPDK